MRKRRNILNRGDPQPGPLQCGNRGLPPRTGTLDPDLEQEIIDSKIETAAGVRAALEPDLQRRWIGSLADTVRGIQEQGNLPVVLCSEAARALVKSSSLREIPHLVVLAAPEIDPEFSVEALGQINVEVSV